MLFLGGITFAEISALRFLSQLDGKRVVFVFFVCMFAGVGVPRVCVSTYVYVCGLCVFVIINIISTENIRVNIISSLHRMCFGSVVFLPCVYMQCACTACLEN